MARRYPEQPTADACMFCGTSEEDETFYGEYLGTRTLKMHEHCIYFSSALYQKYSDDTKGLKGFSLPDIIDEINRAKRLFCCYCKKNKATIGCGNGKCQKSFHYPCGRRNNAQNIFHGAFRSFCKDHKRVQSCGPLTADADCAICFDEILPEDRADALKAPCCQNGWFHWICLQKYGHHGGRHHFQCPLCKDLNSFLPEMLDLGVRVPDRDASWELEEGAFDDLYVQPNCSAEICLCPGGPDHRDNEEWDLVHCTICGARATHRTCSKLSQDEDEWYCQECLASDRVICRPPRQRSDDGPSRPISEDGPSRPISEDGPSRPISDDGAQRARSGNRPQRRRRGQICGHQ